MSFDLFGITFRPVKMLNKTVEGFFWGIGFSIPAAVALLWLLR